ncbi:helix-turn-helix domain-containing protein [Sporomusa termitida]|uniref:Helix-turn-helix protein n=1 Tax=Sporomusa termitida TaxID=2377 RepID=A0A517DXB5_9FIRM|nr:helix-turn-helix transcriptional regulator [Sporomusa termitida]QDR81999.1 helix-turn-helix protein [Sporomusa termitida]
MFSREIFGHRLKNLRQAHDLTQEQLAAEFAVTKQTVSYWEKGDRLPPLNVATGLAIYFNVSLDYIVGLSDNKKRR